MKAIALILTIFLWTSCQAQHQPDIEENRMPLYEHLVEKITAADYGAAERIVDQTDGKRLVLMGEASHGTAEFYNRRAMLSKKLIEEKGFNFIAVEGDWASLFELNKYVKGLPNAAESAREVLRGLDRWPEWMWGNTEVEELAEWMREFNEGRPQDDKVGFYGIDVYGQWEALEKLHELVERYQSDLASEVSELLACYEEFKGNEWDYSGMVFRGMTSSCKDDLAALLEKLESEARSEGNWADYEFFRLHQKGLVLKNSEKHVRLAANDRGGSWNARVNHFWQTTQRLLEKYGPDSRGIVWAHNTHVGDATHTTIMRMQGQVNIGQLSREELREENVFILGFGTFTGRVNAGSEWGSPMQIMNVPESPSGTYEHLFSEMPEAEFAMVFDSGDRQFQPLREYIGHRAIGVVYNPRQESGNYVPTRIAHRYDGFWFIRVTNELEVVE